MTKRSFFFLLTVVTFFMLVAACGGGAGQTQQQAEQAVEEVQETAEEAQEEVEQAAEAVNVGDTDMRPVLTSIATGSPEIIYYPIFIAEGAFVTTQAQEIAGLEETVLAGADGMISPDFISAAGEAEAAGEVMEEEAPSEAEALQDEHAAELDEGSTVADFDTEFPLPDDVTNFNAVKDANQTIIFQTSLSLQEIADFYKQALSAQGLTERTITTIVSDQVVNLVFDGAPNGKSIVVQATPLSPDVRAVRIRFEEL